VWQTDRQTDRRADRRKDTVIADATFNCVAREKSNLFHSFTCKEIIDKKTVYKHSYKTNNYYCCCCRRRCCCCCCCFILETGVFPSLDHGTRCLSHYVTEISQLYSLRDFWRHFGLCRAAAHSDCCFFAPCTNILTYLLTVIDSLPVRHSAEIEGKHQHVPALSRLHLSRSLAVSVRLPCEQCAALPGILESYYPCAGGRWPINRGPSVTGRSTRMLDTAQDHEVLFE